jgi:ribosomal-protein-alanine N-acetyltransferase
MFNLWQEPKIRSAELADSAKLRNLLNSRSFSQRHLGWESPMTWLGKEPFFLLEEGQDVLGALACPPDEDGICWLRVFAVRSGYPVRRAWDQLWGTARNWLMQYNPGLLVNSLVIRPEMERLLPRSGFQEVNRVVVLTWEGANARWPETDKDLKVRDMKAEDLPEVYEIDRQAFDLIWRNSLSQLQAAYQEANSATVIDRDGKPAAYQISTINPLGGHLARLAVNPIYQKLGLATRLVEDLLENMEKRGIVEITVNTQSDNQASLDLYQKFGFQRQAENYPVFQFEVSLEE